MRSTTYTLSQWQTIQALGQTIDQHLEAMNVRLLMGGEPTFVSATNLNAPEWYTEALGAEKRQIASKILSQLRDRFNLHHGLLHYGNGKAYPGERFPRWALGCYWRTDGQPIWPNQTWLIEENQVTTPQTITQAHGLIEAIVAQLNLDPSHIIPAYESTTEQLVGYILPLVCMAQGQDSAWASCAWHIRGKQLLLAEGEAAIGLRIPFNQVDWDAQYVQEASSPPSPKSKHNHNHPSVAPDNSIAVALTVEVYDHTIKVFLPPIASADCFLDLIQHLETACQTAQQPIQLVGYPPVTNGIITGFQITPDPGVLEINIHPASTWQELVKIQTVLYDTAQDCGLTAEKVMPDGRILSTGGGAHITIGGLTPPDSPILRRPDLLRSILTYWQHHPGLSYLFTDLFVGPDSQAPRADETKTGNLEELDVALQQIEAALPPEMLDRLLSNLLLDASGNAHRTEICIDKLFPIHQPRNRLGIIEFRSFAMPNSAELRIVQLLLVRSLISWFWQQPYTKPLIEWGRKLHDQYFLPAYVESDLQSVVQELNQAGYAFDFSWLRPFLDMRFPELGRFQVQPSQGEILELSMRRAIEPWPVLHTATSSSTSRPVDTSMERIEISLTGDNISNVRYAISCNGSWVILKKNAKNQLIGGVRFRAKSLNSPSLIGKEQSIEAPHPWLQSHFPLVFELVDLQTGQGITGWRYDGDRLTLTPPNSNPQLPGIQGEASCLTIDLRRSSRHTTFSREI